MKKYESKLNPLAEEFVPSPRHRLSAAAPEFFPWGHIRRPIASDVAQAQRSRAQPGSSHAGSESSSRIRKDKNAGKESKIKRTVYVSDIDPRITEEELMREFNNCGVVKGSCICGDTQSGLRYGFVEFENEGCAKAAMRLNCTRIGLYPVRVLPSHRTIAPRNRLPFDSVDDQEKIVRTVYCSYIDKMLSEKDLKEFFEIQCGEVSCIRLLGYHKSSTRYGLIEFVKEEFAVAAIKCTGMVLGNYRLKNTLEDLPPKNHYNLRSKDNGQTSNSTVPTPPLPPLHMARTQGTRTVQPDNRGGTETETGTMSENGDEPHINEPLSDDDAADFVPRTLREFNVPRAGDVRGAIRQPRIAGNQPKGLMYWRIKEDSTTGTETD